jgi:hypothetical protein
LDEEKWKVATNSKTCFNNLSIIKNFLLLRQRRSTAHYMAFAAKAPVRVSRTGIKNKTDGA